MPYQYTIFWLDGRRTVVTPIEMADALTTSKDSIALWREGDDKNYVWNQKYQAWEKKSFFLHTDE